MSHSDLASQWDDLEFRVEATVRYHHRRVRFFQRVNTWISVGSLFASSAAAATLIGRPQCPAGETNVLALVITSALALVAAINIIVRPGDRAREHQEWAGKFIGFDRRRVEAEKTDARAYRKLLIELTELERDEPPYQRIVRVLSENDYAQARGLQGVPVSWFKEQFANFIDFRAPRRENAVEDVEQPATALVNDGSPLPADPESAAAPPPGSLPK